MTTQSRVVRKSLACEEDILFGKGQVTQSRNGQDYDLQKVTIAKPVESLAELAALDTTQFLYATVAGAPYRWNGSAWVTQMSSLFDTAADLTASSADWLVAGIFVGTGGYYAKGDNGAGRYFVKTAVQAATDGDIIDGYGNHTLANGNVAILQVEGKVNVKQFGAKGDNTNDDTAAIQAAIDSNSPSAVHVYLPAGTYKTTSSLYINRSGTTISGDGQTTSNIAFVNAAGGSCIAGDSDGSNSLATYNYIKISDIGLSSTSYLTDCSIGIDITCFAYSEIDVRIQTKRANAICIYGQGNAGSSPYYNVIKGYLFGGDGLGGTNYTQTGLKFASGLLVGGSNGGNSNIIGPIGRAAALSVLFDIEAGNGNFFDNISAESLIDYYIRLNNRAAVDSGTSTGSNGQITLIDTGASWTTSEYLNDAVKITGGTGAGQVRTIAGNNATTLTTKMPWAVVPDATSTYEIYEGKSSGNHFSNFRTEGLAPNNPDFIYAAPGTEACSLSSSYIGSLGAGLAIRDDSGSAKNQWFAGNKVVFTENIQNPGPSANIDVYAKSSVFGGVSLAESFVVDWLMVATTTSSLSDDLTVTLDVGGTAVGNGDVTLQCVQPTGNSLSAALSGPTDRTPKGPTSRRLFLNVSTGVAFSATADVQVTWQATIIG